MSPPTGAGRISSSSTTTGTAAVISQGIQAATSLALQIIAQAQKAGGLAAIVDASRAKLQASWPECEFHVVLWDSASPFGVEVREALEARGFEIWPAETLLPGLAADRGAYRIHEADSHPNARAAEELARALAERIR